MLNKIFKIKFEVLKFCLLIWHSICYILQNLKTLKKKPKNIKWSRVKYFQFEIQTLDQRRFAVQFFFENSCLKRTKYDQFIKAYH